METQHAATWTELLDLLAERLRGQLSDPFVTARVLVSSRATGRIVGQGVAARLGISAGVDYITAADLSRGLAHRAGLEHEWRRWHGTALALAVSDALAACAPAFPHLERALGDEAGRPRRRLATSLRIAQLLRSYLDTAPSLLEAWLSGADAGLDDQPLPEHLAWQPEVTRAAVDALEVDPVALVAEIAAAAADDQHPTTIFATDRFTVPERDMLSALDGGGLLQIQPGSRYGTSPLVELHDSHGEARQVEVLRDELTRAFADDPTLQPRDVAIVAPNPARFARLLDAAFAPLGDAGHPGRTLRVQAVGGAEANPVLTLAERLVTLPDARATASELLELLLSAPIAHRWRLTDRTSLTELVVSAGIRWGVDADHRDAFGLGDLTRNTWLRGLDRILAGLAVAPGDDGGLDFDGAEAVTATDLELIGSVSEIFSRIRRFLRATAAPLSVSQWAALTREHLGELVGLPRDDEWQIVHADRVLTRLETDHAERAAPATRQEFAALLRRSSTPPRARVAAGNGSLQVVPLGELRHVGFRLVAMIGLTDDAIPGRAGQPADCVDLAHLAPDPARDRLSALLEHARSAERLLIVRQHRSQRTNDPVAEPVAVSWLVKELGVTPTTVPHAPTASAPANYQGQKPSFDLPAYRGALARASTSQELPRLAARRRQAARTRALGPVPRRVTVDQLQKFLADPAKAFLRSAAGMPLYEEPRVSDEIPLDPSGLSHWSVCSQLLDSLRTGASLESVVATAARSDTLPPGELGRLAFEDAKRTATALWSEGGADWSRPPVDHDVRLTIEPAGFETPVELVGSVRTRGGVVVEITPSKGDRSLLQPWVSALAATAAGRPTTARVHRLADGRETIPEQRTVEPGSPDEAIAQLATLLGAYAQGQTRLVPAPLEPSLAYAREALAGTFRRNQWTGRLGDWMTRQWKHPSPGWLLFYGEELSELFEDPPLPEDPPGAASAFEAWSAALYTPLVRSLA